MSGNSRKILLRTQLILLFFLLVGAQIVNLVLSRDMTIDNIVSIKRRELSESYSIYTMLETQANQRISMLSNTRTLIDNAELIESLYNDADNQEKYENAIGVYIKNIQGYCMQMDIYLVTNTQIIKVYNDDGTIISWRSDIPNGSFYSLYDGVDFTQKLATIRPRDEVDEIIESSVIIRELPLEGISIIGVPQYNDIMATYTNESAILNNDGEVKILLNTNIAPNTLTGNITLSGEEYKIIEGINKDYLICYYYPEGDSGDYCITTLDYDEIIRPYWISQWILSVSAIFMFGILCILYWRWSLLIMGPLSYFDDMMDLSFDVTVLEKVGIENWFPDGGFNLRSKVYGYYMSTSIPVILILIISLFVIYAQTNERTEQYYHSLMKNTAYSTDIEMENSREHALMLSNDKELHEALDTAGDTSLSPYAQQLISHILFRQEIMGYNIKSIRIINIEGNTVYSSSGNYFEVNESYLSALKAAQEWMWVLDGGIEAPVLYHRITTVDLDDDGNEQTNVMGYLEISYGDIISDRLNAPSADNPIECYLVDNMNEMYKISGSLILPQTTLTQMINVKVDEESFETYDNDGNSILLSACSLPSSGFKMVYLVPVQQYLRGQLYDVWKYIILVVTIIIVSVVIAIIMSERMLRPIRLLAEAISDGDIKVRLDETLYGRNEFRLLAGRFNRMMDRLNVYAKSLHKEEQEHHELEARRRESEIIALQTQINPHFLYNIFTSIAVLIRSGNNEQAVKMVTTTGNLMRVGIYKGSMFVDLSEEIDHINQYIGLQKIRYSNRIILTWDIDEKLINIQVVKFILQPIIENSIEHGLEDSADSVIEIIVSAKIIDDMLIIFVDDNGSGMDEKDIKLLQMQVDECDVSEHIGLANVNERIMLNCGQQYGLTFHNKAIGLRVEIKLPIKEQ